MRTAGRTVLAGAPEGVDALALAELARGSTVLHIASRDLRLAALSQALAFFAPDLDVVAFPAWDCMPYDRVSPKAATVSQRMEALGRLAGGTPPAAAGRIVLTTAAAAMQRVPPRASIAA